MKQTDTAWPSGRPVDRLFAAYAAISGLALLFPGRPAGWPVLLAAHACAVAVGLAAPPARRLWQGVARRWPGGCRLLRDWYPLLLVPALYEELSVLNRSVWNGVYFDGVIQAVEQTVFRGQPSRDLAAAFPIPWLSAFLHASYISYYLIIFVPPLILYLRGRRETFRRGVFTLMLAFFAHYLFFIYFPVQGPRYLFQAPGGAIADGYFYQLAHRVLEAASSRGAAFPSSHVGASVAQVAIMADALPWLTPVLAFLTAGLGVGAVYGGFHYATDAIAGLVLGLTAVAVAPTVRRRIDPAADSGRKAP